MVIIGNMKACFFSSTLSYSSDHFTKRIGLEFLNTDIDSILT